MQLNDLSTNLASKFTLENPRYSLDENMVCHTYDFLSDISLHFDDESELFKINLDGTHLERGEIENKKFRYAIFVPAKNRKFSEAIILLHGLNERYWKKYLPWAYQLALQTQKPVILFPIAYHMNRSPVTWVCPRLMYKFSASRKAAVPEIENSTFVNVALSLRINNCPELFSLSGIQTYFDIVKLTSAIKAGHFEIFEKDCHIDFFAYSIGALLTETLMISNPLHLFSNSKAFFFCGGSTFDKINGSSRAIMDSHAFAHLRNHLLNNISSHKNEIQIPEKQGYLLKDVWKAFLAMSGNCKYINHREKSFMSLKNRIKAIGLKEDTVVPGHAIKETFGNVVNHIFFDVEVLDFPFKYSHEVPFPENDHKIIDTVTRSFNFVFGKAALFLA